MCFLYPKSFVITSVMGIVATLYQTLADRSKLKEVIHHSDRSVPYLSMRYTNKMADCCLIQVNKSLI